MPFKKLHPHLQEKLEVQYITTPTAFQKKSIPLIKSGANVYYQKWIKTQVISAQTSFNFF